MQFQYNADYPYGAELENVAKLDARDPLPFPPAQPIPCTRITTRVYHPTTQQMTTVQNVLVRTAAPPTYQTNHASSSSRRRSSAANNNTTTNSSSSTPNIRNTNSNSNMDEDDGDVMFSSSSDSDFSDSDDDDDDDDTMTDAQQQQTGTAAGTNQASSTDDEKEEWAYWIQRTVREAIYGRVLLAIVLKKTKRPKEYAATAAASSSNPSTTNTSNTNSNSTNTDTSMVWQVTPYLCAVKEMSWQHIRKERNRLAENPIQEVNAMQYLQTYYEMNLRQRQPNRQSQQPNRPLPRQPQNAVPFSTASASNTSTSTSSASTSSASTSIAAAFESMIATNVMMPLDILSDEHYLYSIMPYANGGELFEWLDQHEKFTEAQARYWMNQIFNGLECLQHAGICHRDLSLENLLVHESGALIIDMGMCLRIPVEPPLTLATSNVSSNPLDRASSAASSTDPNNWTTSFGNMNLVHTQGENGGSNGGIATTTAAAAAVIASSNGGSTMAPASSTSAPMGSTSGSTSTTTTTNMASARQQLRFLIQPQGTCGKWIYMSPEIYKNATPFDGFAVDMWAAGVILFLMVTGFPPWDRACSTDERFRYMSAGYLVQMLTEWDLGLSPDVMDLLQRMLFVDPKDRLSLDQVRAHPWMVNGPCEAPPQAAASFNQSSNNIR